MQKKLKAALESILQDYPDVLTSDQAAEVTGYHHETIVRDVTEQINLVDKLLFRDFIRAAACRTGQMLNIHDIASDVGVSDDTAKRWLQVLENRT